MIDTIHCFFTSEPNSFVLKGQLFTSSEIISVKIGKIGGNFQLAMKNNENQVVFALACLAHR